MKIETIIFDRRTEKIVYISLSSIDMENGIWKCITAFSPTNEWYEDE